MSYYRASLAAAKNGCLNKALNLARCSMILKENAPNIARLHEILTEQTNLEKNIYLNTIKLVIEKKYFKALKITTPITAKAHMIRGLLYMFVGRRLKANKELIIALTYRSACLKYRYRETNVDHYL